jgi:hypothetical protein
MSNASTAGEMHGRVCGLRQDEAIPPFDVDVDTGEVPGGSYPAEQGHG